MSLSFRSKQKKDNMRESIEIKNLGPLKDVQIRELKPLTVLIGESASGKSTLMKVVVLMRYIYKMLNIRWYLKNSGIQRSPFKLSIESLLNDDLSGYFKPGNQVFIRYAVEVNGHEYYIEYTNGKMNAAGAQNIPNEDLLFLKESWVSESRNVIPVWVSKSSLNKKAELGFYFHETLSDFEKATEAMHDISMEYVGMNMYVVGQNGKKKYYVTPLDESYSPIELKYASSGIQTSAPLIALVNYFSKSFSFKDAGRRSILDYLYDQDRLSTYRPDMEISEMKKKIQIHIEEPELSLFPNAQCKMIDDIVRIALMESSDDRDVELMLATHSPYIVNYLNILLNQNKKGRARVEANQIGVYRIFEGKLQNLVANTSDGRTIVDTSDLTEQMQSIMKEYRSLRM